jgi:hypothetical protein
MILFSFVEPSAVIKTLLMPYFVSTTTPYVRSVTALSSTSQMLKMPRKWL